MDEVVAISALRARADEIDAEVTAVLGSVGRAEYDGAIRWMRDMAMALEMKLFGGHIA